jgi:hypothetical protein
MIIAITKELNGIPLDVVVSESHQSELEITNNPVEFGAEVTDHAYIKPITLSLEAVIGEQGEGIAASEGRTRVAAAWQALRDLQASAEPFDVASGLELYENMLIRALKTERTKDKARVLSFTADLQQVILVDTRTIPGSDLRQSSLATGSVEKGTTEDRCSTTTQRGNVGPEELEDRGSLAYQGFFGSPSGPEGAAP